MLPLPAPLAALARRLHDHPPYMLVLSNVICGGIGLLQGLTVAALLGPASFGIIAIPVMIGLLVSNFWDIRLTDVATKLHFSSDDPVVQTANARACLELSALLSLLIVVSTPFICYYTVDLFTDSPIPFWWLWMQAIVLGLNNLANNMMSVLRLTGRFMALAIVRILNQLLYTTALVLPLALAATLNTYYVALFIACLLAFLCTALGLHLTWLKTFDHHLGEGDSRPAFPHYKAQWRLFLSTNLVGYTKMMTRSGDVLLVGLFANDTITGVYRLSRSVSDGLGAVSDALYSYYFPTFTRLLQKREYELYARNIRRFFIFGFGGALGLGVLIYIILQMAERYVLQHQYLQLAEASAILAFTYGFVWGIHMWLWPLLVNHNAVSQMTRWSLLGGILQLGLIAALMSITTPAPALAALCAYAYYLTTYIPLLRWARRDWKELT